MEITIGTRIFYTGDIANNEDWGTVSRELQDGVIALKMDEDKEEWLIEEAQIGDVYEGHCDPRFVTLRAYDDFYNSRSEESAGMKVGDFVYYQGLLVKIDFIKETTTPGGIVRTPEIRFTDGGIQRVSWADLKTEMSDEERKAADKRLGL